MNSVHRSSYVPQLEVLEDRLPPGSLSGSGSWSDKIKSDEDALILALGSLAASRPTVEVSENAAARNEPHGSDGNPEAFPPNSHPHGRTYGEWSAAWWQWAFSIPADQNPLLNNGDVTVGQTDHVWFLAGTVIATVNDQGQIVGQVTRDVTIPSGTALFFPLINTECSTLEGNGTTEQELRACAHMAIDAVPVDSLFTVLDGKSLVNLGDYRAQSPLFTYGPLPDNNLLEYFGVPGATAGATSQSVSDGYYIMLKPLSVGHHTLQFGGEQDLPGTTFIEDITYNIDVAPHSR